jgi:hypothetical protein
MAAKTKALLRSIVAVPWGAEKVSGIDLSSDFYWVDDDPDVGSVAALETVGKASGLLVASTDERPNDLARVRDVLKRATHNQRDAGCYKSFTIAPQAIFLIDEPDSV